MKKPLKRLLKRLNPKRKEVLRVTKVDTVNKIIYLGNFYENEGTCVINEEDGKKLLNLLKKSK